MAIFKRCEEVLKVGGFDLKSMLVGALEYFKEGSSPFNIRGLSFDFYPIVAGNEFDVEHLLDEFEILDAISIEVA